MFVNTTLGGAAGIINSMGVSWYINKRPDLANTLNGALAGLVGVTASADIILPSDAIIVGGISGLIVVFSAKFFDSLKIDDPVGAISVYLICGIWGTLAVGIFGSKASLDQFISQCIGIISIGLFISLSSFVLLLIIRSLIGLRVSSQHEIDGLDIAEHKEKPYFYSHNTDVD